MLFGGGDDDREGPDELVESSEGPSEPVGIGRYREAYTLREAWPYLAATVIVVVLAIAVILSAAWLRDVWGTTPRPLGDLTRSGTVELRTEDADPPNPYGPHAFALNVTLAAGDVVTVVVTSVGPIDGVEVFIQHPLHPTNASSMPATVWSMGAGSQVSLSLEATAPGAYQVYVIHPGAVRPPPLGVDPFDWNVPAQVTYSVMVVRAG
jgi:hypothetical protein